VDFSLVDRPARNDANVITVTETKSSLTKGAGDVIFDQAKGRIDRASWALEFHSSLKFKRGGVATQFTSIQKQVATLVSADERPTTLPEK
jgi:hypothetical protein